MIYADTSLLLAVYVPEVNRAIENSAVKAPSCSGRWMPSTSRWL
jgi:hypothetical protein